MAKSKYDADTFPALAEGYAREGMIDKDIAAKLGVGAVTLYEYLKRYPELSEALKKGKAPVDFEVENCLLKRARGYRYKQTTRENVDGVMVVTKTVTKEVSPDVTAQIFWLKNRRPDRWRDKQEVQHSGGIGVIPSVSRHGSQVLLQIAAIPTETLRQREW